MHSSALAACSCVCFQTAVAAATYPGTTPGASSAHRERDVYTLSNNILSASWMVDGSRLIPLGIVNRERVAKGKKTAIGTRAPELFHLSTEKEAFNLPSSRFMMERVPAISALKGIPSGLRPGERTEGVVISAVFRDKGSGLTVHWKAELREGASYVKENYRIEATKEVDLKKMEEE